MHVISKKKPGEYNKGNEKEYLSHSNTANDVKVDSTMGTTLDIINKQVKNK